VMEVPMPDVFQEHAGITVSSVGSPSSNAYDDDIPAGTAGRAAALGL